MKLGILGTGMIVKNILPFFDRFPLEKKVILGTPNTREETEKLATEYHLDGCFYDYDALLASDIDTVYVALPNHLHYSFTKKALEHGKHAIVEKPITANSRELEDLNRIAAERQLMVFEGMNTPHLPAFHAIQEDLPKLGKIKIVSMNYSQYSHRYDAFKEGTILPAFDPHKAGGALMDLNVYNLSFIIALFGKPLSVDYLANIERGIDTSGIVTLRYPDFCAVSIGAKDCKAPMSNTIQGDNGSIVIDHNINSLRRYVLQDNEKNETRYEDTNFIHRMYPEFLDFIRAVDEKDYAYANKMMNISIAVSQVMEEARRKAGIVFDSDLVKE